MHNNISLIISREYTQRVRKKAFIFTTIFLPIVMLAIMFGPILLQSFDKEGPRTVYVVDDSGEVGPYLAVYGSLPYSTLNVPVDSAKRNVDYENILYLQQDILDSPAGAKLFVRGTPSIEMEMLIRDDLKQTIENVRLEQSGHAYVNDLLKSLEADVDLATVKLTDDGGEEHSDTLVSFLIGIIMAFILYMFIIIYGQMVMMGIIEEKNNRVLELIVTSVKPSQLMFGKIVGVGLVAVTQVLIWGALIAVFVQFILPAIAGPELGQQIDMLRNGVPFEPTYSMELLQTMAIFTSLGYIFSVLGWLILFLVGGFMLYAAIYAAIGSAFETPQDASQMQVFVMVPVIVSLVMATNIGSNPDSALAMWLSMIPFTSPMIMMARIPAGVPTGEILLSLLLLYASVVLVVWFAAKIYRTGIFMYGKKPTLKEIIRWARYK